ncbi:TcdA/TcdB catalytic glycosyltransferase domain-containing protein [Burkholderia ambifaria]|uniref:TcdA/TcdB catalytic glycosyltransferase domain-containing protein n=1 Tax=Burkholderia ambifaria TaxID=152480 RepID=UPI0015918E7F|nr:TcdA/TcdB catalytic glycosyltransferase domain-containing protein [Burkholderia ambifaria]
MNAPCFAPSQAAPYVVPVPLDGVTCTADGQHLLEVNGVLRPAAWYADLACWILLDDSRRATSHAVWRAPTGDWHIGMPAEPPGSPRARPGRLRQIELPPVPPLASDAKPLPRTIHYIWLGETGMPAALRENVLANAHRCTSFRHRLHAHATTVAGWERLVAQFPPESPVELVDTRRQRYFDAFVHGPLGRFYEYFLGADGRNYAAASDLLRVHIVHREGGIYADVDDVAPAQIDLAPRAGPDDVLVNSWVTVDRYDFRGYSNNNFAAHAGNGVLAAMLCEMHRRLNAERALFETPRPWRRSCEPPGQETPAMLTYIKQIFRLTGPTLFSDMLRNCRPDYFHLQRSIVHAYRSTMGTTGGPRILALDYFRRMDEALKFYVPFATPPFKFVTGAAHSWNPPVDDETQPLI